MARAAAPLLRRSTHARRISPLSPNVMTANSRTTTSWRAAIWPEAFRPWFYKHASVGLIFQYLENYDENAGRQRIKNLCDYLQSMQEK